MLDGGFLSVEHDRVTVVSDTASLGSGSGALTAGTAMAELLLPLAVLVTLVIVLVGLWAVVLARAPPAGPRRRHLRLLAAPPEPAGARGWVLGVARYEADRLDWFQVLTVSPRPTRSLARERLVILEAASPRQSSPMRCCRAGSSSCAPTARRRSSWP